MTTNAERLQTLHQAFLDMAERLIIEMKDGSRENEVAKSKQALKDLMEEIKRVEARRMAELDN